MFSTMDEYKAKDTGKPSSGLVTEGPLSEKDEQGEVIERTKLLQEEAKKKWAHLKNSANSLQ